MYWDSAEGLDCKRGLRLGTNTGQALSYLAEVSRGSTVSREEAIEEPGPGNGGDQLMIDAAVGSPFGYRDQSLAKPLGLCDQAVLTHVSSSCAAAR